MPIVSSEGDRMVFAVNDRFILAEETALKAKLEGLGVRDPRDPEGELLPVDVWFRWPNKEIRQVRYPFVALDLAGMVKSDRREHSGGPFPLEYTPPNLDELGEDEAYTAATWPTPYDLTYTATVVALDPRHDRELKARLLGDPTRLPHRGGYLAVEDETLRRLETLGVDNHVVRDGARTQFMTVFTLNVETELFVSEIEEIRRAEVVSVTLKEILSGITHPVFP